MASEKLRLFNRYFPFFLKFSLALLYQRIQAAIHRLTYSSLPSPQNVVILGSSFAGTYLARRLTESLPSGYKVILIEKNSHFNYTFNFPRYSVLQGHEQQAFIPFHGLSKNAPKGIYEQIQDEVTLIEDGEVELASGKRIAYAYLAIATGARQPPPAKLLASEQPEACTELKVLQKRIEGAERVAVVGGGAMGVQLSADIRSFYPNKKVVLIHSREQLLPNFGDRLHKYVIGKLETLGVEVLFEARPVVPSDGNWDRAELTLKDGTTAMFDLVVCDHDYSPILALTLTDPMHGANTQFLHRIWPVTELHLSPNAENSCQANAAASK